MHYDAIWCNFESIDIVVIIMILAGWLQNERISLTRYAAKKNGESDSSCRLAAETAGWGAQQPCGCLFLREVPRGIKGSAWGSSTAESGSARQPGLRTTGPSSSAKVELGRTKHWNWSVAVGHGCATIAALLTWHDLTFHFMMSPNALPCLALGSKHTLYASHFAWCELGVLPQTAQAAHTHYRSTLHRLHTLHIRHRQTTQVIHVLDTFCRICDLHVQNIPDRPFFPALVT